MIVLHRKKDDEQSDQLEQRLNDLVLSFKKVNHENAGENLPYIEEDGTEFHNEEEIESWLRELKSDLSWQRSLSGDGCYINPKDGKIC